MVFPFSIITRKGWREMDIDSILMLKYDTEENKEIIQGELRNIKPFKKYGKTGEPVPFEMLEKYIELVTRRYEMKIQWISLEAIKGESKWWHCDMKTTDLHTWLGPVYGESMYELFCKISLKMYSHICKGDVKRKDEN